ncbi:MAG: hypothetical protein ABJB66_17880 [Gemmatimonadaceae bacterium]
MHQILLALIVAFIPYQEQTPSREAQVVKAVLEYRALHLRDSTKIGVCDIPETFDQMGNVDASISNQSIWRTRRECNALIPKAAYNGAFVRAVRFNGDTATVYVGRRFPGYGYRDEYQVSKNNGRYIVQRYCITDFIQN